MIRIKKVILYLCMVALLVSNISITAFASDLNDGVNDGFDRYMGGTNIQGFNSWDITDKKSLFATNIVSFFSSIGMYFRNGSGGNLMDIFTTHLIESDRIENADSLDEYIASHLTANTDETELYMSSDLTNALHETAVQYIEEETGYYIHRTADISKVLSMHLDLFASKNQYENFLEYVKNNDDCYFFFQKISFSNYSVDESLGTGKNAILFCQVNKSDIDFVVTNQSYGQKKLSFYDKNWETKVIDAFIFDEECNVIPYNANRSYYDYFFLTGKLTYYNSSGAVNQYVVYPYEYASYPNTIDGYNVTYNSFTSWPFMASDGSDEVRVYKTLSDLKQYSFNQRPYYVTEKFVNYDSSIDNSTTITQTEIDNSVTYGDVYNYITNNYENPDGLSEDELRAILAEYLSQINNNNSGGGSGGSGDSGGSGGGLGGFLDGLGSVGNAILAILGKLMEILGSAIELVTGAITDLITIIPNSIGELLGALFPVFPEEWIKAITLSLVLGVVVGIVRMFK